MFSDTTVFALQTCEMFSIPAAVSRPYPRWSPLIWAASHGNEDQTDTMTGCYVDLWGYELAAKHSELSGMSYQSLLWRQASGKRPLNDTEWYFSILLLSRSKLFPSSSNLSTGERNSIFFSFLVAPHPLFHWLHTLSYWADMAISHFERTFRLQLKQLTVYGSETSFIHPYPFISIHSILAYLVLKSTAKRTAYHSLTGPNKASHQAQCSRGAGAKNFMFRRSVDPSWMVRDSFSGVQVWWKH